MHKYAYVCKGLLVKYILKIYFVVLMLKHDYKKYVKYTFPKYVVFESMSMFFVEYYRPKGKYVHVWFKLTATITLHM